MKPQPFSFPLMRRKKNNKTHINNRIAYIQSTNIVRAGKCVAMCVSCVMMLLATTKRANAKTHDVVYVLNICDTSTRTDYIPWKMENLNRIVMDCKLFIRLVRVFLTRKNGTGKTEKSSYTHISTKMPNTSHSFGSYSKRKYRRRHLI